MFTFEDLVAEASTRLPPSLNMAAVIKGFEEGIKEGRWPSGIGGDEGEDGFRAALLWYQRDKSWSSSNARNDVSRQNRYGNCPNLGICRSEIRARWPGGPRKVVLAGIVPVLPSNAVTQGPSPPIKLHALCMVAVSGSGSQG